MFKVSKWVKVQSFTKLTNLLNLHSWGSFLSPKSAEHRRLWRGGTGRRFGKRLHSLKSNCQSIVIKLMNFPTLLTTTQNSNSLNQMSWYWCKKVKSCKKKIKSCLGAIVGHPPKNALYHSVQMVLVDPCDKLIICFLWVLKGGKHNYWWHMASIIMFTTF